MKERAELSFKVHDAELADQVNEIQLSLKATLPTLANLALLTEGADPVAANSALRDAARGGFEDLRNLQDQLAEWQGAL
jgi:hypothetical protein